MVTITRYQNTFWIFDFSLLDILPKYMNPKIVLRTLYALHDLQKNPDGRTRTKVPKGAIKLIKLNSSCEANVVFSQDFGLLHRHDIA